MDTTGSLSPSACQQPVSYHMKKHRCQYRILLFLVVQHCQACLLIHQICSQLDEPIEKLQYLSMYRQNVLRVLAFTTLPTSPFLAASPTLIFYALEQICGSQYSPTLGFACDRRSLVKYGWENFLAFFDGFHMFNQVTSDRSSESFTPIIVTTPSAKHMSNPSFLFSVHFEPRNSH